MARSARVGRLCINMQLREQACIASVSCLFSVAGLTCTQDLAVDRHLLTDLRHKNMRILDRHYAAESRQTCKRGLGCRHAPRRNLGREHIGRASRSHPAGQLLMVRLLLGTHTCVAGLF